MTPLLFALVCGTVCLSALAQVALKAGVSGHDVRESLSTGALSGVLAGLANPYVLLGLTLYGLSALLWLYVLARLDVSVAYPFVGLGFIVTMFLGFVLLHEPVGAARIIGTLLVATGVALIARS